MPDAVSLFSTSPIMTGILCALLLKEPYTINDVVCGILGFIGIIIIAKPP